MVKSSVILFLAITVIIMGNIGGSNAQNQPNLYSVITNSMAYNGNRQYSTGGSQGLLASHVEILRLLEIFLQFKGEVASKARAMFNDNYDLIRSVTTTVINKLGNLHNFSLAGIRILRSILEYAVNALQSWQPAPNPVLIQDTNNDDVVEINAQPNFLNRQSYY